MKEATLRRLIDGRGITHMIFEFHCPILIFWRALALDLVEIPMEGAISWNVACLTSSGGRGHDASKLGDHQKHRPVRRDVCTLRWGHSPLFFSFRNFVAAGNSV